MTEKCVCARALYKSLVLLTHVYRQGDRKSSVVLLAFVSVPSEYQMEAKEMECNTSRHVICFSFNIYNVFLSTVVSVLGLVSALDCVSFTIFRRQPFSLLT